ncbi:MAG: tyrosine--tRNA ligase [Minisyncoccia bacterium]
MKVIIDEKKIDEIINRSVAEILPSKEEFKKVLMSGKKIRFYIGTDPTGTSLHIGHATNYMVLERLRKLGHEAIFLIGDFTARVGDPTDKSAVRKQLTRKDVKDNVKTWLKQIQPIVGLKDSKNPVKVLYNHDWLSKLSFEDVINLSANFTVQQMLERDMFSKRMKENKSIYLHEFFYPLMQGYDSVAMDVDMELCGNDQKFNALMGRTLLKRIKNKEKFVFITTLLENPVTKEKMMSKSLGTGVFLDETPNDMYGKLMAQADENIPQLFVDCTYVELSEIEKIKTDLKNGNVNPRDLKMKLAYEIVKIYHGEKKAKEAEINWENVFSKKEIPDEMEEIISNVGDLLMDVLVNKKALSSKGEWRRLVEGNAVHDLIENKNITDPNIRITENLTLKIGKKKFLKIVIK